MTANDAHQEQLRQPASILGARRDADYEALARRKALFHHQRKEEQRSVLGKHNFGCISESSQNNQPQQPMEVVKRVCTKQESRNLETAAAGNMPTTFNHGQEQMRVRKWHGQPYNNRSDSRKRSKTEARKRIRRAKDIASGYDVYT